MRLPDSLDELSEDPEKFGMPTFEQFRKNKEKWMGREDDEISAIDRGDPALGCLQKYYIEDVGERVRLESLESAERIARDMGLNLFHDFITCPQLRPNDSGGFYNEVTFRSKRSVEKRSKW